MNINQVLYLKELVYYGSFTAAAQIPGTSQPALSAQIKKLEEEVELVLVDRNKKPIQLTSDGEIYYSQDQEWTPGCRRNFNTGGGEETSSKAFALRKILPVHLR